MILVFDTETTGLDFKKDQVLELAIVDGDGNKLLHERYRPTRVTEWSQAQAVHGISPADVASCPTIDRDKEKIIRMFNEAELVVGYNVKYDLNMLWGEGIYNPNTRYIDIMPVFAEVYGEYDFWRGGYRWQKLTTAADYYGYQWTGAAHGAHADTLATLFIYKKLIEAGKQFVVCGRKGVAPSFAA